MPLDTWDGGSSGSWDSQPVGLIWDSVAVDVFVTGQQLAISGTPVGVESGGAVVAPVSSQLLTVSLGTVTFKYAWKEFVTQPPVLTASVGSITISLPKQAPVTGQQVVVSVGTVTVTAIQNVLVAVTGQSVQPFTGTVSIQLGSVVFPSGLLINASVGTASVVGKANVPVGGQTVLTSAGTVSVRGDANVVPAGQQLVVSVGTPAIVGKANVYPDGQELQASVGVNTLKYAYKVFDIASQLLTVSVGEIYSPNWGVIPEPPDDWYGIPDGASELWTPVPSSEKGWTDVPLEAADDWTPASKPQYEEWVKVDG